MKKRVLNADGSFSPYKEPKKEAVKPAAAPKEPKEPAAPKTLEEMSVKEMRVLAEEKEIDIKGLKKGDDIRAAIQTAMEPEL